MRRPAVKALACPRCGQLLTFESTACLGCSAPLGYQAETGRLLASPSEPLCTNAAAVACNWLVPPGEAPGLCRACRLTRTLPDLDVPGNRERWVRLEQAKRRLVYGLLRLKLPVVSKAEDRDGGLAFDFLASTDVRTVMTGHSAGLITLNIAEADDDARERVRTELDEPYRTLLGHFRHESGHYYWERLVRGRPQVEAAFRSRFGDERADYGDALARHHADGAPADWERSHVSAYAAAHPWEDFAETWAHYLHIVDTLETATAFNIRVAPDGVAGADLNAAACADPYEAPDFDALITAWLPLTYAVNAINRSMGYGNLYPFVLSPPVLEKLRFVHGLVRG